ncbi:MAG: hypothetical protein CBE00_13730 [Planctomycetaceae bacterium TMED240]|nr:hypothetical protein [Rhodopirellula sp.]OUX03803.1 MAG: hypothetical protein CBE00_13730 [Planctomycetaceae bacterium TMED240]
MRFGFRGGIRSDAPLTLLGTDVVRKGTQQAGSQLAKQLIVSLCFSAFLLSLLVSQSSQVRKCRWNDAAPLLERQRLFGPPLYPPLHRCLRTNAATLGRVNRPPVELSLSAL